jgi:S-adenosylmethionine:tRNA ribosyltransferase-isomerase
MIELSSPLATDAFDYPFDEGLIAIAPLKRRTGSRLLIYDRKTGEIRHQRFSSIIDFLHPNDLLVINNTRVFPARLYAKKEKNSRGEGGGEIELLLLRPDQGQPTPPLHNGLPCWEVMVKGHLPPSAVLTLNGGGRAYLIEDIGMGKKKMAFKLPEQQDIYTYLGKWGEVPLPPYILRQRAQSGGANEYEQDDVNGYQTVYAKKIGSVAAPTAGLHFTKGLLAAIRRKGVSVATVTLHIGIDTFRPIQAETLTQHKMSGEWFEISEKTAYAFAETRQRGGRVFSVGTSATRAMESAWDGMENILPSSRETDLFITPGYRFHCVDALITNLHPPRSTGIVLVTAFAGYNAILPVYREAIERRYRFFTYGDAMLIL